MLNAAFGCLLATLLIGAIRRLFPRNFLDFLAIASLGLSWIFLTGFLSVRWNVGGFAPLSNQFESLVSLTWSILLFHFIFSSKWSIPGLGFWTAILALLFLSIASLLDKSIRPLVPALQSNWLLFHVSTTLLAYAALSLAALSSIVLLIQKNGLAKTIDAFTFRATILGFILLTLGIVLGAVWANEAWGTYWSWDPKETWSLITWFIYALAIHLRRVRKWEGRRFAWISIGGFACVLFTYFGVNYLLAGLHSYA